MRARATLAGSGYYPGLCHASTTYAMPTYALSTSYSCTDDGAVIEAVYSFDNGTDPPGVPQQYYLRLYDGDGNPVEMLLVPSTGGTGTFAPVPDGFYTAKVQADPDGAPVAIALFDVDCAEEPSNAITLTATGYTPTAAGGAGSIEALPGGGTAPLTLQLVETGATQAGVADQPATFSAVPPGTYTVRLTDSSTPAQQLERAVTVPPFGATPPVAVFDSFPTAFTPVHLPVVFTARITEEADAPVGVVFVVEVTTDNGVTWQPLVALRRTGTAGQVVQVNLSEYLKPQFASPIQPPLETGNDAALWVTYRVLLQAATETLATTPLQRVLNASAPRLSSVLSQVVHPNVPEGLAHFRNVLGSTGVRASTIGSAVDCLGATRQFVWLNVYGGWNYGLFKGKHELNTEAGGGITYRDQQNADRWATLGEVREVVAVYSDRLTAEQAAVLRGIRRSIQVYERLPSGQYVPVIVRQGSFREYQVADRTYTVDLTVAYPVQQIQTQ